MPLIGLFSGNRLIKDKFRFYILFGRSKDMSEILYSNIMDVLKERNILPALFDISRVVEPESGMLMEFINGDLRETLVTCTSVFGTDERCKNCSSLRAHYSKETVVKLEYANNAVLFILSIPIELNNRYLVVELAKDITKSMTVDVRDSAFSDEVPSIIDRLNKLAATDPLTGLQNRRAMDEGLSSAIDSCCRMGLPISLAMIDIDRFKEVNDIYGHQCGDIVLKNVAGIVKSYVRHGSDFAVRYGGEEILLCLPGVSLQDCLLICSRLHEQIQQTTFKCEGIGINITVSIGVASSSDGVKSKDEIIALADERLYHAKQSGRNKIVHKDRRPIAS